MNDKIDKFAALVQAQQLERLKAEGMDCETNINNAQVKVIPGSKYTKVNIGSSGRYMIELSTGNIYGIKGYGVIHRGHYYGTLDTAAEYTWGDYYPERISAPLDKQKYGIPALTFAPSKPQ
jgi:hypothetical protein